MIEFDISTGKSRHDTNWKIARYEWAQFCFRLQEPHRTAETYKTYLAAKKDRQDEIKDIGGFVGGVLANGRRKKNNVLSRQLLTLDADSAHTNFWQAFTLDFDCAACLYSTHKHSPEKPRYRLIIPLDREVRPDEYEAIMRRMAEYIGIEQMDPTTYQAERLMYWPSVSSDGEYEYRVQHGPALSANDILGTYRNWQDITQWPRAAAENLRIRTDIKAAADPLTKPGLIGAFCRAHTISDAIDEFLKDDYTLADGSDDRYTYVHGSTAGGAIVYDDKFIYSHHATDPCSGQLCNAFDMVRLHKFGLRDRDKDGNELAEDLNFRAPSFTAMLEWVGTLKSVKAQVASDIIAGAQTAFEDVNVTGNGHADPGGNGVSVYSNIPAVPPVEDPDWHSKMDVDKHGHFKPTLNNLHMILKNDDRFRGNIIYDELQHRGCFNRAVPWRRIDYVDRFLNDQDLSNIEHFIESAYNITTGKILKALDIIYVRNKVHPIKEYLKACKWDGTPRMGTLFADYLGAWDSDYLRAVTRKTLTAAVARVFDPGVKFDSILTLIGEQGKGKSTLIRKLGGPWFSDTFSLHMLQGNQGYEQMRGAWIIEIGELSGMAKTEVERIKSFVASGTDRYRSAYGRMVEDYPRQCIFMATTNKVDFLRDQSGNRRFWPVVIDADKAVADVFKMDSALVAQIWAEAYENYKRGETLYLDSELETIARSVQTQHTEVHPWYPTVHDYLNKKLPEGWEKLTRYERRAFLQGDADLLPEGKIERDRVCVLEIWVECLGMNVTIDERSALIIKNIMLNMDGWKMEMRAIRFGNYGRQRNGFVKTETFDI
jgi:predicted P-loop ATPase